jgi:type II secretory pathway component GspD/PulD (secretin)
MRATTNFCAILLASAAVAAWGQAAIEVISLRNRTAEQVIPILQPLLAPGGALTGQYNQLIVRTTPENLAQIRSVLDSIDRPARRLMVLVRYDNAQDAARSSLQTDARISNRGAAVAIGAAESRSLSDERVDQRVQVLEGGRAYIGGGESRPLRQRQVIQTPTGTIVQDGAVVQEAATGFEVSPRVSGSNVFLDIYAQQEAFAGRGAIRGQQASSTVSGRLGEWIELGGVSASSTQSGTGMLSSRGGAVSSERRIWVKVEELR